MGLNIFVLEDDKNLNKIIESYLIYNGFNVTTCFDGETATNKIYEKEYDLYIIDIMVPKGNGLDILKEIRTVSSNPALIITALDSEEIEIKAFKNGTDDYITKPFSPNKLLIRIEAILRRANKLNKEILNHKEYTLDLEKCIVKFNEENLNLLKKEFEIFKILILNKGNILSREKILDKVWGYDYFGTDRIVDAQIKNLRKKLKSDVVKTIKGRGYLIE
ncbi:response regulator transcription factor [Clostridium sp. LY3-2]|uniref:response regulator transcription factor n=1 Tax=Clostridium sp. LY3-2 TaxID=2942482 RepID=UPI002152548B|nr:response regulator transcription factor [Clostridium sp. LY3-2]MCR6515165.1 response regulator transcription factor [Clostridium sp. LY3-2]